MAIGMRHIVGAPISGKDASGMPTYGQGMRLGPATLGNLQWERSDGRLYGEDVQVDGDNGIVGGSLEMGVTWMQDVTERTLLGYLYKPDTQTTRVTGAAAPHVGCGYIRVERREDEATGIVRRIFRAIHYFDVQFGTQNEQTKTKERSIEWNTPVIHGSLYGVYDGESEDDEAAFREQRTFSSLAAAVAWLDERLNVAVASALTVASAAGSTTGKTALTITGYTPAAGESYLYKIGESEAPAAVYGTTPDYTWTAWDGSSQITATTGHKITVISVNEAGKIVAAGSATITSKT